MDSQILTKIISDLVDMRHQIDGVLAQIAKMDVTWQGHTNAHSTLILQDAGAVSGTGGNGCGNGGVTHNKQEQPRNKRTRCPYQEIYNLWQTMMPELPQPLGVEHWTAQRKNQIRARWHDQLPDMESWEDCFSRIRRSKFLMGRVSPTPGKKLFRCDLFWITKPENLLKLYEGKYHG